ncbi:hypothetical protein ACIQMV_35690 [Streptomyces sp. NPDC091412]|uniref:hypothetical protein n=1 Tax=unclassified Streptomyces TaxID=2593676 RepID=UPI001143CC25|nr:hypothetical protein [Streptomyces sp. 6-11-2]GED85735.1 hypothetical protein TNCT6_28200 [Streptomyces sp. 6-11-2]
MGTMEMELSLYDWARLPCRRCKSAEHVPEDLLRMAGGHTREETEPRGIEGHVFQETWGTETVVPVARVLMAGLAGHSLSVEARHRFLDLLWGFVVLDDDHLAEACKDVVRSGIWSLYEEVLSGRDKGSARFAYWLLEEVETAPARVQRLLQVARDLLPENLD